MKELGKMWGYAQVGDSEATSLGTLFTIKKGHKLC